MGSAFKGILKILAECAEILFGWLAVQTSKLTIQGVFTIAALFALLMIVCAIIYFIGNKDRF